MDEPSDRDLVRRTRSGEANAFGRLVQRYQSSVFNVCYRMMGQVATAEEMTQESFLRAYRRLETFDDARPFGPWMRRVATSVCLNELERKRLVQTTLSEETLSTPDTHRPEALYEKQEETMQVRAAIQTLQPEYRAVIELRHFQELSYEEIASALNLSLSAVKSRLFRARKQLSERLKHDE